MTEPACESSASVPVRPVWITVSWRMRPASSSSATPPCGNTLARPQSITWTSPKLPTMIFEGFRSRWMTPRTWA